MSRTDHRRKRVHFPLPLRYNTLRQPPRRGEMLQASDHYRELRLGRRGLWLAGTSLDGDVRRGVGVVCDGRDGLRSHANLLCSQELALCLGLRRGLFVPWQQTLTLGQQAVALSPAGAGPGSALARLHASGSDWLDARALCLEAFAGFAPAAVPEAEVIVVDGARAGEVWANAAQLHQFATDVPPGARLALDDVLLAFAAARALQDAGRAWRATPLLKRAWRRRLGPLAALPTHRHGEVTLGLAHEPALAPDFFAGDPQRQPVGVQQTLAVTRRLYGDQARAAVQACGARVVVAVGGDGRALAQQLPEQQVILLRPLAQPLLVA
ncbi:MAG: hypothetical protein HY902_13035 [Deltaproteobacteria bacterium]|nr:hypothetical protein [Deltaproteobacteria bacterium]